METSLLNIGEYAAAIGLSVSAVRFYADRGLLPPRSVHPTTGYRQFSADQVEVGILVRDLRRMQLPLAQVKDALMMSAAEVFAMVQDHVGGLEREVAAAREIARDLRMHPTETVLRSADLRRALEQVLPCASNDEEQPHLMTVRVQAGAGSLSVAATDAHRLAVGELPVIGVGESFSAVLAAATVAPWLAGWPTAGDVSVAVADGSLSVAAPDFARSARMLPVTFPDVDGVLSASMSATAIEVDRIALTNAIAGFVGDRTAVALDARRLQLTIERGTERAVVDAETTGQPVRTWLDPTFVFDALSRAVGPEAVIEVESDPLRPVLFRSATDGTYVSLVMPVRCDE